MTLDPTIKPQLLASAQAAVGVLHGLGRLDDFDVKGWANDTYIRAAYKQAGLDYDAALASTSNYPVTGEDAFCHRPVTDPASAGEVWLDKEPIHPAASTACALAAAAKFKADGNTVLATYVFDAGNGVKLFADKAFYAIGPAGKGRIIAPYLLRAAAEARAGQIGGIVADFAGATAAAEKGE